MSRKIILTVITVLLIIAGGCKVSYSFSGASISAKVKTVSVQYFQNRASLVQPSLSQNLTDALIDKCKAETNLKFVSGSGDVNFDGEITDYNTRPLTVGADAAAATNRFSITVRVKFTNAVEPELSYDQQFSRYADYSSNLDLSDVEDELSEQIIKMIVEDVFNQAFVNW
ncbi:MAG TPA: LptE family protein [Bacteroidales bacterium]|nr:LptE family protein [Bacteroidales bacterium]